MIKISENALAAQRQYQEAVTAYQQALQLKPDFSQAHLNLAEALKALDQSTEVELTLKQAIALNPNLAPAYVSLGRLSQNRKEYAQVEAYFRQKTSLLHNLSKVKKCQGMRRNLKRNQTDLFSRIQSATVKLSPKC